VQLLRADDRRDSRCQTLVVGYTDGIIGYLPDPYAYRARIRSDDGAKFSICRRLHPAARELTAASLDNAQSNRRVIRCV
jgi:hypothetical protein